jgi:hypothetical protein
MRGRECSEHVTSLSKHMRLCSYILVSFLQSESDDNRSIPQPSAWFPVVSYFRECHSVVPIFLEEHCFCSASSWQHGMISTL